MLLTMGPNGPVLHEGSQVVAPGGQLEVSEERARVLLGLFPDLRTAVAAAPDTTGSEAAKRAKAEAEAKAKEKAEAEEAARLKAEQEAKDAEELAKLEAEEKAEAEAKKKGKK